ncbi:6-phospho-3-hexuloisomerase [Methermicoccus shengliensis]|nr:MAG: 6-phospho-3-hexuloisomerase [Euryarchaeota archaeon 55_53]KUK30746.1 MAG: 6-phospho-3-hexuloisomerase [Methanosarcinales archeaon 56_1174]
MNADKLTHSKKNFEHITMLMHLVADHLIQMAEKLDKDAISHLIDELLRADAIFLMGAGRSGLVARAFAMRLMHLGLRVYVVGETTTPAVKRGDLVIAISGSGETSSIANLGKIAKQLGAKVATFTSNPASTLGSISDIVIPVSGGLYRQTPENKEKDYLEQHMMGTYRRLTPLGTLFEISTLVLADAIIAELIARTGTSEEELRARHSMLE